VSEDIEGNVIWIPFELRLVDQEKITALHNQIEQDNKKLKEMGDKTPRERAKESTSNESTSKTSSLTPGPIKSEGTVESFKDDPFLKQKVDSLEKKINAIESKIGQGLSFVSNPFGFLKNGILSKLGAAGLIATFGIEAFQQVFTLLTAKNMPFDLHFKRIIATEYDKLRSREYRQDIRIGVKQVIFTSGIGQKFNPLNTFNNLNEVRNGEIFKMDSFKIRKGYNY
jgi:hypothetical protein